MTRRIPIVSIAQSSSLPGSITIGPTGDNLVGDWTSVFRGKFYRQRVAPFATQEFYTSPTTVPVGFQLIAATQFEIVDNATYNGRYTVYTQVDTAPPDVASTIFASSATTVHVNEPIGAPGAPIDVTSGFVTNVSTYYIYRFGGETAVVVPPGTALQQNGLDYVGRDYSGWGESLNQNYAGLLQHFASATAPTPAALGMLWFDTTASVLKIFNGTWQVVNDGAYAPATSLQLPGSGTTWTLTHNFALAAPHILMCQFFIDVGAGVHELILPSSVAFNANNIVVTFTAAHTGFALLRK